MTARNAVRTPAESIADAQLFERRQVLRELLFQARETHAGWTAKLAATVDHELLRVVRRAVGDMRQLIAVFEAELSGARAVPPLGGHTLTLLHEPAPQEVRATIPEVVHVMEGGLALCHFTTLGPKLWPDTHGWVAAHDAEHATCDICRTLGGVQ